MRPRGSYGDVAQALLQAAGRGPASVRALAERAQVGYGTARYTASRLLSVGDLVVLDPGVRPAVLAIPDCAAHDDVGDPLADLGRLFALMRQAQQFTATQSVLYLRLPEVADGTH